AEGREVRRVFGFDLLDEGLHLRADGHGYGWRYAARSWCHRVRHAAWKRKVRSSAMSTSYSIPARLIDRSQASHTLPLPYPAQNLAGASFGRRPDATLAWITAAKSLCCCSVIGTPLHGSGEGRIYRHDR